MTGPDANDVRPAPKCFRPGPTVQIYFTDFAVRPRRGFLTLFTDCPQRVVGRLLQELGLEPQQVRFQDLALGDVAVLRRMPADSEPSLQPGRVMPAAFLDGLNADQLAVGVALLLHEARAA